MKSFNSLTAGAVHIRFLHYKKGFIDRLHVNLDILVILFLYIFFCTFFYAAQIGYTIGCHYPTILNSLGHCICVQHKKISAAAGFEPGTPGLWVNHATNELSWRHILYIYISTLHISF